MSKAQRTSRRLSPAFVISCVALFISLGGVGYAAVSIGSAQIADNSVESRDIKDGTIAAKDLSQQARDLSEPVARSSRRLASGKRIYGTYALEGQGPHLWTGISFQVPAPVPVDSAHVVVAHNDIIDGAGCTGTAANPISAPGFVCIYTHIAVNTTAGIGWGALCACGNVAASGDGSRFGFIVQAKGKGEITASGVWVYTAP